MQRFVHLYLITAATLVALLLLSAAAIAAPKVPAAFAFNPMIRTAAAPAPADCVRHVRGAHSEALVNRCDACMVVGVTRNRRGIPTPEVRSFHVLANSTYDLPFRGPGRTSVGSIVPCDGANLAKPESLGQAEQQCIRLETDGKTGGVFLVNTCRVCRAAAVVRMAANGKPLGQSSYVIGGKGNLRLAPEGAAKVGLTGEDDCPRLIKR